MSLRNDLPITPELIADHGLKPDEYERILKLIGREPTLTELGIFSAMWNEHCSYKSSKKWLRTLPTTGKVVIQGPGENAGVIDIGDGLVAVFKMESHNHPSYIEPYQGAATGVGGILRDVFTMGARPIAAMNALRFGDPEHPRTRHLVAGVVAGIGGYGNSFGVPTVGGEVNFHRSYNGNCLVNAFALGIAKKDAIFYSKAEGVGLPVVYLGAKTGRDGVGGATMASAEFDHRIEEKRPTVQVGDPFTEKRLLEACLELMATGAVVAIQDMGAAGLTCSAVEMGAKGDLGIALDLDKVPTREPGMTAYEMMLSESQERMLMVLRPEKHAEAEAIFRKWGLDFADVGRTTDDLRFKREPPRRRGGGPADQGPRRRGAGIRPAVGGAGKARAARPGRPAAGRQSCRGAPQALSARPTSPRAAGCGSNTTTWCRATPCSGRAATRRSSDSTVQRQALALSVDVTPRYVAADPFEGGKQAVAECWRNLTAVGATPLAATDNLNFGNPEKPDVMGSFVRAIEGVGAACRALDFPIVSGNVSLYNETNGEAILPTPAIGGVGLIGDWRKSGHPRLQGGRRDDPARRRAARMGHAARPVALSARRARPRGRPSPAGRPGARETRRRFRPRADRRRPRDGRARPLRRRARRGAGGDGDGIGHRRADRSAGRLDPAASFFGEDQGRYVVTAHAEDAAGRLFGAPRRQAFP